MKKAFLTGLALSLIILFSTTVQAQEEYNVAGGYGTPEMANIGIRMRFDQNQFGLNVGTNPGYKNKNLSLSADYYYHFTGRSGHTSLRPWFLKAGLTYMSNEGEWEKRTNVVLVPRLGREFNVTSQFGVALEAGMMFMLMDKNEAKKERPDSVSGDLDLIGSGFLLASAGFKFFYRLE